MKSGGVQCEAAEDESLSLRRAWIEIWTFPARGRIPSGRSPYGERGLKLEVVVGVYFRLLSLSLRRAWIEIPCTILRQSMEGSLSLRRAWIEMLMPLKRSIGDVSLSLRRAWIEIIRTPPSTTVVRSLSLRRAWIEIATLRRIGRRHASLSLRRAWIEIRRPGLRSWWRRCRSPYGERGLKCS